MATLPEPYQRYAQPGPRPVHPAAIQLAAEQRPAEREASVWVESADDPNLMVRIPKRYVQATPRTEPRDLTPQPLLDPVAQRLVGAGVGGGILLWGGGQFLIGAGQLLSSLSGVGALLFFLALAGGRTLLGGGRQAGTRIEVHNHVRGFGRSHTTL
jgi:hypothetical protein